ncbi:hypothetical protein KC717_05365 [Candidatus Dojkabacteria bacterium]|uniref:Uncharacterized protein n=1 Tax=Candidatus Dojkabacteria bacterium TaxID=2099670 RepID=A0A955RKN0_9BACT|nr:hypothetical protein [Candidatus Dojkabacteria bacterium]
MSTSENTLCKVLKPVRIYGVGYKENDKVEVQNQHLNHYGKSIEPIKTKTKTETKKEGDK